MKEAYIMRGLPGSGKSFWVKSFLNELPEKLEYGYFSTDTLFMEQGVYKFDKSKIKEYHAKNLELFSNAAKKGKDIIICDNTNMKKWEYQQYVNVAEKHSYKVIIKLMGDPNNEEHQKLCAERNTHNVPIEQIKIMANNFNK